MFGVIIDILDIEVRMKLPGPKELLAMRLGVQMVQDYHGNDDFLLQRDMISILPSLIAIKKCGFTYLITCCT